MANYSDRPPSTSIHSDSTNVLSSRIRWSWTMAGPGGSGTSATAPSALLAVHKTEQAVDELADFPIASAAFSLIENVVAIQPEQSSRREPHAMTSVANIVNIDVTDNASNARSTARETSLAAPPPSTTIGEIHADSDHRSLRRQHIIAELLETEHGYVNDLQNLVRNVFDPLNNAYLAGMATVKLKETAVASIIGNTSFGNEEMGSGWVTFDQKQAVVRNGGALLRTQKLFCKLLDEAVTGTQQGDTAAAGAASTAPTAINSSSTTPQRPRAASGAMPQISGDVSVLAIARCFLNMMVKLEAVYLPFCSQHDTAIDTINHLRKAHPSQFQTFLDECRTRMNTRLDLQDFLIKPVQRICKYPLLLAELLKSTPAGSVGASELQDALTQIKQLVSRINDNKKSAEKRRKKELFLERLEPDYATAFVDVLQALNLPVPENPPKVLAGDSMVDEALGNLLRSSAMLMYNHDDHGMPFLSISPSAPQPSIDDVDYLGAFLFEPVFMVVFPQRSNVYRLIDVIPTKSIVNVLELEDARADGTGSNLLKMRHGWRITWQIQHYYRSIDFGCQNDKERQAWLYVRGDGVF